MVYTDIEKAILDKLFSHGYIGKKHTPIEYIQKGIEKALTRRTNT